MLGTGIKGLNFTGNTLADELRLNCSIPVTPAGKVSRMGVLGGDNGGFPNGRRLDDDVIDIAEQADGRLPQGEQGPARRRRQQRRRPDLDAFPYEADPPQGYANSKGQQKP